MAQKAAELDTWSQLVLENLATIPADAETVTLTMAGGTPVLVRFDRAKYGSPHEQAIAAAEMAGK